MSCFLNEIRSFDHLKYLRLHGSLLIKAYTCTPSSFFSLSLPVTFSL